MTIWQCLPILQNVTLYVDMYKVSILKRKYVTKKLNILFLKGETIMQINKRRPIALI